MISSMIEWKDQMWTNKDWMTDDPLKYCGLPWVQQITEPDQDWMPTTQNVTHDV